MTVIEFPVSSARLSDRLGLYRFDPLGFVQNAFPWGRPGPALDDETRPESWQREVLQKLGYDASDTIRLERKDDMRKRGLASSEDGDALALTFAYPVYRRNREEERRSEERVRRPETANSMSVMLRNRRSVDSVVQ